MSKQQEMIQAVYNDGEAEINGNKYGIGRPPFKAARSVLAYQTKITPLISRGDYSFIDTDEFKPIEKIINRYVSVDGVQLEKDGMKDYWESHQQDYLLVIGIAIGVICHPFTPASAGS